MKAVFELLKLLLLLLYDYFYRGIKFLKYVWYQKHEFERICDSELLDIYEKSMRLDQWIDRTNCKQIRLYVRQNLNTNQDKESSQSKATKAIDLLVSYYQRDQIITKSRGDHKKTKSRPNSVYNLINLEDGDITLSSLLRELTDELCSVILVNKHSQHSISSKSKHCLTDALYRIVSYRMTLLLANKLAATKYDADSDEHTNKVISLWNNLIKMDQGIKNEVEHVFPSSLSHEINNKCDLVSNRWSHIGFQGEDPGTDFRGMGLLGLIQLEYLSRKPKNIARDLLKRSLNDQHSYPFAIVGINITYNLLNLFKDGSMKHLYYDTGDVLFRDQQRILKILSTFNNLYIELFLRFDCFWHQSKPKNIFEFRDIMSKFVKIVKLDLETRNFSLKFIY